MKRAFPQARVLFTGILLRKKTPTDVVRGCNACLCNLCVEENIGYIPLSSDLQTAGGKTVRAKYFDGDGVHLNERGVANMLREYRGSHTTTSYEGEGFPSTGQESSPHHRPTQPQERQSYVRDLVVICSEGRGRRLNRERACRR